MKPNSYYVLAACFTSASWNSCSNEITELLRKAGSNAAVHIPNHIFIFKRSAHWIAHEICSVLKRTNVQFVLAQSSEPLLARVSPDPAKAIADLGIEVYNAEQ
jgi:hypothetical protein